MLSVTEQTVCSLLPWVPPPGEGGSLLNETEAATVRLCVALLEGREQEAVRLRFWHGHTLQQLALRLHMSREGARQLVKRAMRRLRALLVRVFGWDWNAGPVRA